MSEKEEIHYGWYSAKAAQSFGTATWEKADGTQVDITCVTSDPEGESYMWDDKVPVGKVIRCVRARMRDDGLYRF